MINLNISTDESASRDDASSGLLVDGGHVMIENSVLNITRASTLQTPVLVNGSISTLEIRANTVINTPATNDSSDVMGYLIDTIVAMDATPTSYVVTGGSFLVKYHTDTGADYSTTPTNGAAMVMKN